MVFSRRETNLTDPGLHQQPAARHLSNQTGARHARRGWRGWRKHVARALRRRRPDDLLSLIGMWLFVGLGLLGLYFAGTIGLYAAVALVMLVVFVIGLVARSVKRVARLTRSRTKGHRSR
jgi:hypothetical protein